MDSLKKEKLFFPNLDGLRFICFLMVFLFHCQKTIFVRLQGGNDMDQQAYRLFSFLFNSGETGVNFFFVLSGYLITFLLFREKEHFGQISVGKFYVRRILRIWPLFYLCLFIGFVVTPGLKILAGGTVVEPANPWMYLVFLNNFDYISLWPGFPDALILIVLWSVAVEEQFYLAWPLLLQALPRRYTPWLFGLIITGSLIFRAFFAGTDDHSYAVRNFHTLAVIGDMAVGALLAYLTLSPGRFRDMVSQLSRNQLIVLYTTTLVVYLFRDVLVSQEWGRVLERLIFAILFGMIIVEQNFCKNSLFKFSGSKRISSWGIITYGLYCFHFFVISVIIAVFGKLKLPLQHFPVAIACSLVALVVTILTATISYRFIEKPLLRRKDKFAMITRGAQN